MEFWLIEPNVFVYSSYIFFIVGYCLLQLNGLLSFALRISIYNLNIFVLLRTFSRKCFHSFLSFCLEKDLFRFKVLYMGN